MAGLWDRVNRDSDDRINIHLLDSAFGGYYVNAHIDGTKGFTRVQVRDHLNSLLETPLDAAAETDLNAIADEIDALANDNQRKDYLIGLNAVNIAAAERAIGESKWRNDLGI